MNLKEYTLENTIKFQKTKLEALQKELENTISTLNKKELELKEAESKDKSVKDESKRHQKQVNNLNDQIQRMKKLTSEYEVKIDSLERVINTQKTEFNKKVQEKDKTTHESTTKDLKYYSFNSFISSYLQFIHIFIY